MLTAGDGARGGGVIGSSIALASAAPLPGRSFDAYCARPAAARPPAVLLLPEMFGLSPAMRESAEAFARRGHVTLAPNLFWRAGQPQTLAYEGEERAAAIARLATFDINRAIGDIADAVAALRALAGTDRIVAIGHCIGGRLAVLAAARLGLAGAVSYYGLGLSAYPAEMRALATPVQLHYGLADEHVPLPEIDAVAALVVGNPRVALHRYPKAGHSFVNPYRPMFDPPQAEIVMERTLALLDDIAGRNRGMA
jgi:carboxymethylenebutenolidase